MKKLKQFIAGGLLVAGFIALATVATPLAPTVLALAECGDVSQGLSAGVDCADTGNTPDNLFAADGVFTTIVNVLLFIIGAISVIMLIIGGIRYTLSGGDSGAVTSAKNTILYAIIGLIVAFLAFAIVNFVLSTFTPTV